MDRLLPKFPPSSRLQAPMFMLSKRLRGKILHQNIEKPHRIW